MLGTDHKSDTARRSTDIPGAHPIDAVDLSVADKAALTPHDEILAELYGHRPETRTSSNTESTPNVPAVVDEHAAQDSPPPESTVPTYTTTTSASASASAPIAKLYDPFSGTALGVLAPHQHDVNPFPDADRSRDEELWSHLADILRLQSDIAETHLQMEAIGPKRGASDWAAGAGVDEDEGTDGDEDVDGEKAREEKFAKLADTFVGRRQKIDGVMGKLSDLSQALSTFHALRTPEVAFPRSNAHPPSRDDSGTFDIDSKSPTFPITHSTPQLSTMRPQPMHSHSQPGSSSLAVPSLGIHRPLGILRQPVVESPLSMASPSPDEY